jgi:hypothetical protein
LAKRGRRGWARTGGARRGKEWQARKRRGAVGEAAPDVTAVTRRKSMKRLSVGTLHRDGVRSKRRSL